MLGSLADYKTVYFITTGFFCAGIISSSLEYLAIRSEFRQHGVYSWKIFSSKPSYLNSVFPLQRMDFLFQYRSFVTIHFIRILCGVSLPFVGEYVLRAILITIVAISSLLLSFRNIVGNDGSDQMNSVICIALFVGYISDDAFIMKAGLIFIASQSILSYGVAGIAKMLSTKWRQGLAVYQIMNTRTYGHEGIARYLTDAPKGINSVLCWSIILFESLFVLVVFIPAPYCLAWLLLGIAFHIYNAGAMGLNNFLWAFVGTYPAIIFLNQLIRNR